MQVYADNAATTKPSRTALDAMLPCFEQFYGNPSSLHHVGQAAAEVLLQARQDMADCLGCEAREIYFTSGGSEADNQALRSAAWAGARKGKKHIVSTAFEHHAVLHTLEQLKEEGFTVTLLDVHETGRITPEEVEAAIQPDTCLVSVMYANNEIGTIEPIAEIGAVCRKHGVPFHTDAVQAVGHVPINVYDLNVDLLSASAHKFNGPKGIGFLYIKKGVTIHPYANGGSQERGNRAGTENVAGIVGMAAALQKNTTQIEEGQRRLKVLEETLVSYLKQAGLDFIRNGAENHLPGNVSLSFRGADGEMLLHRLDLKGICISTGSACDSVNTQVSHVIKAIDVPKEYAEGTIRITFGADNTEDDVNQIANAIIQVMLESK